jgi:hypothetical protein
VDGAGGNGGRSVFRTVYERDAVTVSTCQLACGVVELITLGSWQPGAYQTGTA